MGGGTAVREGFKAQGFEESRCHEAPRAQSQLAEAPPGFPNHLIHQGTTDAPPSRIRAHRKTPHASNARERHVGIKTHPTQRDDATLLTD